MKRTIEQLKAELMAEAEAAIDELLGWHEDTAAPTLTQVEDMVLELRRRLGERMTEIVVEDQEAVRPVPGPACRRCGREMHYKGMKEVTVEGRTGRVRLERGYYYCDRCKSGLFPPGSAVGIKSKALE